MKERPPTLNYDTTPNGRVGWSSDTNDEITIVISSVRRQSGPSISNAFELCGAGGILGLLLSPVLVPLLVLAHSLLASRKPRAVIRISRLQVSVRDWGDEGLGWWAREWKWSRRDVGEFRRNQFEPLLFLRVPGTMSYDLLERLDEATLTEVCRLVDAAMSATLPDS